MILQYQKCNYGHRPITVIALQCKKVREMSIKNVLQRIALAVVGLCSNVIMSWKKEQWHKTSFLN